MGNLCNKQQDDIKPANLPNHKRKGPTMVSYDFDSAKGQIRSIEALSAQSNTEVAEEGKRVPVTKNLGKRR